MKQSAIFNSVAGCHFVTLFSFSYDMNSVESVIQKIWKKLELISCMNCLVSDEISGYNFDQNLPK